MMLLSSVYVVFHDLVLEGFLSSLGPQLGFYTRTYSVEHTLSTCGGRLLSSVLGASRPISLLDDLVWIIVWLMVGPRFMVVVHMVVVGSDVGV